ncbi:SPL family radical SAM protein [Anaeromicropila populeti]|uniref:DNA repair photolyase n=1 Tax=Anaeromicropila populeti TaxID=37658 RepID=A0A1I6JQ26_9FIRM|nr:radical SAM protein [Anaeromicropila populeti]SFR80630.1 DNA repair photolyase [Anaeromicropila populeti]
MDYIPAKTIVSNYQTNPNWFGTNYTMNIYKGCCHGCIYCDSRSDCYRIENFDNVRAKENALLLTRNDLRRKTKKGVVGIGSMSDPYNPFEKELQLTRHALELISAFDFGVALATKSPLVTRDIDILTEIKDFSPVLCKITITTADASLCKIIEPNVASSSERFEAVQKLSDAGIYSGILLMPVLPFITDTEENILSIVKQAYECGAKFVYASFGVTLRSNQRDHYYNMLQQHFPSLQDKYMRTYGNRYCCTSPKARKLWGLFAKECEKYGLLYKMPDIIRTYKSLPRPRQLSLFDF